jgi:hypothetical protein
MREHGEQLDRMGAAAALTRPLEADATATGAGAATKLDRLAGCANLGAGRASLAGAATGFLIAAGVAASFIGGCRLVSRTRLRDMVARWRIRDRLRVRFLFLSCLVVQMQSPVGMRWWSKPDFPFNYKQRAWFCDTSLLPTVAFFPSQATIAVKDGVGVATVSSSPFPPTTASSLHAY